jgi:hypothetical protein
LAPSEFLGSTIVEPDEVTKSLLELALPPIAAANSKFSLRDTRVIGKQKEKPLVLTQSPVEVLLLIELIGKIPQEIRSFYRRNWLGHTRETEQQNPVPAEPG